MGDTQSRILRYMNTWYVVAYTHVYDNVQYEKQIIEYIWEHETETVRATNMYISHDKLERRIYHMVPIIDDKFFLTFQIMHKDISKYHILWTDYDNYSIVIIGETIQILCRYQRMPRCAFKFLIDKLKEYDIRFEDSSKFKYNQYSHFF